MAFKCFVPRKKEGEMDVENPAYTSGLDCFQSVILTGLKETFSRSLLLSIECHLKKKFVQKQKSLLGSLG